MKTKLSIALLTSVSLVSLVSQGSAEVSPIVKCINITYGTDLEKDCNKCGAQGKDFHANGSCTTKEKKESLRDELARKLREKAEEKAEIERRARTVPKEEPRWAAIAATRTDSRVEIVGIQGQRSKAVAEAIVLAACQKTGVPGCKVTTTFNSCGFFTAGKNIKLHLVKGYTGYPTSSEATSSCKNDNLDCNIPIAVCGEGVEELRPMSVSIPERDLKANIPNSIPSQSTVRIPPPYQPETLEEKEEANRWLREYTPPNWVPPVPSNPGNPNSIPNKSPIQDTKPVQKTPSIPVREGTNPSDIKMNGVNLDVHPVIKPADLTKFIENGKKSYKPLSP
jgi:hypothetical protein